MNIQQFKLPGIYHPADQNATTIYSKSVEKFLSKAKTDASDILTPLTKEDEERGTKASGLSSIKKIRIGNSYSGVFIGSHNHTSYGSHGKNNNNAATRATIAVIAVGILLFVSHKIGTCITKVRAAHKELKKINKIKSEISSIKKGMKSECDGAMPQNAHIQSIEKVIKAEKSIFMGHKNSALASLALSVALAAGCIIAIVGVAIGATLAATATVLAVSNITMATGSILGLAAICGMLLKWGLESDDKKDITKAETIKKKVVELLDSHQKPIPYSPIVRYHHGLPSNGQYYPGAETQLSYPPAYGYANN